MGPRVRQGGAEALVLFGVDDAAADVAGAGEVVFQRVGLAAPDGPL